jgi:nickel-dependent lactate racemase
MNLPYGKTSLPLPDLWDGQAIWLEPGPFPDVRGPELVEKALDEPIGSPPIGELDLSGKRIACVVPDLTRRAAVDVYLPVLLSRLISAGAHPEDVTIVVALGIHRPLEEQELKKLVGSEVWGRFRVVNHDPDARDGCVTLGVTSGGITVEINRTVADADRVVLSGGVTYHYFAGYGGGRKAFLPGVASRRTCEAHHRMVVSWRRGELTGTVGPGVLEGNPVHDQMLQACSMAPPFFTLNVVTNPDGGIISAFSGDLKAAHLESCRMHDTFYRQRISVASKLVIASAGGYPKDVNFVQAHKGLYGAHEPVYAGGVVILLAECGEGAGYRDFFDWFNRCTSEENWLTELEENYHINAQTAFSTWLKARRSPTILISELDPSQVKTAGMIPAGSVEEAIAEARAILGDLPVPVVLPDAGDTLTVVDGPTSNV